MNNSHKLSWSPETMFQSRRADENTQIRAGVGIAIFDTDRKILLERRSDCGWWGMPGGRIDPGESISDTVIREAFEETGLHVRIIRFLGVYSGPQDRIVTFPERVVQLVDVIVEAEIVSGELTVSHESLELGFFDLHALPAEIVPPARAILEDLQNGRSGVIR